MQLSAEAFRLLHGRRNSKPHSPLGAHLFFFFLFWSILENSSHESPSIWAWQLPCRFCNGRVIMPPAAAAATSPWMFVRFAVGSVRTRPCWPPSCPAMLKGMRIGWLRAGGPPGITPATAEANCCAVRRGCKTRESWLTFYQNKTWPFRAQSLRHIRSVSS